MNFIDSIEERSSFALIYQIIKGENPSVVTDEENYFIARTREGLPTWIWTKEGISEEKIEEVKEVMENFLTDNEKDSFTCKKAFYDILKGNNFKSLNSDYYEMGSYYCPSTIEPRKSEGKVRLATSDDADILAKYNMWDLKEIENMDISYEESLKSIVDLIDKNIFYVWTDDNDKIVCTAVLKTNDKFARINHVYTPVEDRCKGYAKNLIYVLTQKAIDEGFTPVLYTDYNYPASNKAYKAVGYVDTGVLINFSCSKQKLKKI